MPELAARYQHITGTLRSQVGEFIWSPRLITFSARYRVHGDALATVLPLGPAASERAAD